MPWIAREIRLAQPRLLITLGSEVAGVVRGVRSAAAQTRLLVPRVVPLVVEDMTVPTIHCAHPGILMRGGERNPWPEDHRNMFVPAIREALSSTGAAPNMALNATGAGAPAR